ncbi:unnamed protein product [Bursaphelenchus xylophilus]|uniref:(pine wood nematode) hypothetical protein n=1 Tax=Bursaphelenchus xylophilus TaxID=6326 RepID=A0A1I7RMB2_BURXY|nr:unnamed protein product [Bursaphelenchus xylophilus]CAG9118348.1 unnamed protein product [Bursaphelenchus xylophilus]
MDIWLSHVMFVLAAVEFVCGVVAFVYNFHYGPRFWKSQHFHANVKKIVLYLNLIISVTPMLRPLVIYTFTDEYPLQNERYIYAVLMYFFDLILYLCQVFLHTKFLILVIERMVAYKNRRTYENTKNNFVSILFAVAFSLMVLETVLKTCGYLAFYESTSIDKKLQLSLTHCKDPLVLMLVLSCCYAMCMFGCIPFYTLRRFARRERHNCTSLSERFELRQTEVIADLMVFINKGYAIGLVFIVPPYAVTWRCVLLGMDGFWRDCYDFSVQYIYTVVGIYSVISSVCTIKILNSAPTGRTAKMLSLTAVEATEADKSYFKQYEEQWRVRPSKK